MELFLSLAAGEIDYLPTRNSVLSIVQSYGTLSKCD